MGSLRGRALHDDAVDPEPPIAPEPPIDPETLRAWIALAKRQPKPVFADADVEADIKESYTTLRGLYDYDPDEPAPVTHRALGGLVRVAEAAAKFELSDTIEDRHVEIATELVGQSMQDIGRDAEGRFDADVLETGRSKTQQDRKKALIQTIEQQQAEHDGSAPREAVIEALTAAGYDEHRVENDLYGLVDSGAAVKPEAGHVRYIGEF